MPEVKNLNFSTTDDSLKAAFRKCQGFRSAVVMRKKSAVKKGAKKDRALAKQKRPQLTEHGKNCIRWSPSNIKYFFGFQYIRMS